MPVNSSHLRRIAMACCVPVFLAGPAVADPALGFGLSVSFGGGAVDTGLGLRVFSDNIPDSTVGAAGVDYMFNSQSWRGAPGVGYLGTDSYVTLDMGIGFADGAIDFGLGAGVMRTSTPSDPLPPSIVPGPICDNPDLQSIDCPVEGT